MGDTQTTTTSGSASPAVQSSVNKLASAYEGQVDSPAPVFGKSLYAPMSAATRGGVDSLMSAAGNQSYAGGLGGAMADFGDIAAGNRFGMDDPGYKALRAKAGDDTLRDVNAMFTTSNRFGSGSHVKNATERLGEVYAGMDYGNYQNDIGRQERSAQMMPSLYQASLAPGQSQLMAGSVLDADANAALRGEADLYNRQNSAKLDWLNRISSGMAGTAAAGGQTQTTTEPGPSPLQTIIGGGIGLGSLFL